MVAPVVGAFAEMSSHVYAFADLIASLLAAEHCSYFARSHVEANGVLQQRLFRSWGLGAHLGWMRLLIDAPTTSFDPATVRPNQAGITISVLKRKMNLSARATATLTNVGAPSLTDTPVRGTRWLS